MFNSTVLCYYIGSIMGNWQYLYVDLWTVFILTVLMGGSEAVEELSVKRPSGDLLSFANAVLLGVHCLIVAAFQLAVFLDLPSQPGYVDYTADPDFDSGPDTMETTSLFYFTNLQYVLYALLFAPAAPWKKPAYTNRRFTAWLLVCLTTHLCLLFSTPTVGFWRADDVDLPFEWRWRLAALMVLNVSCSVIWELLFFPYIHRWWKAHRRSRRGRVSLVYGHLKTIEGEGVLKRYHRLRGEIERHFHSDPL